MFRKQFDMNFIRVNAEDRFLGKLANVVDAEQKRKIIGEEFIRVFEAEAQKIENAEYLVQGTIYPDIIESGAGDSKLIKSHHNVGGLPEDIDFKGIIEPLADLFKDEVRRVGLALDIPADMIWRQPFPGPGLGIRIIGDITKAKADLLRDADAIYREEIAKAGLDRELSQYFAVLTNLKSVGVKDDARTYDYTLALRAVKTVDFMTAEPAEIPFVLLRKITKRITDEVSGINRIVYDITGKPPATIEWE
ncbi:MAG TPA: glutamine-hydrolyzing GMP synthase, partial [Clostridiaceae bacterium]|nr:glutamine-hydrolyzing GMP synthase [Clostridiaceae bacterium]